MTRTAEKTEAITRALSDVLYLLGLRVKYIAAYQGLAGLLQEAVWAVQAGDIRASEAAIVALEEAMDACDAAGSSSGGDASLPAFAPQNWYALRTATRRERAALASLTEARFTVFLPMETRWRQTPIVREVVQRPLLPGYLFVLCAEGELPTVLDLDAVHAVVMKSTASGDPEPMAFPLRVILGLQIEERSGVYDYTLKRKAEYRPKKGESVKITAGTWMGFVAKVLNTPRGQRVHVMVEAFGKRTGKVIDVKHLTAAA